MNAYDLEVCNFIAFILYIYFLRSNSIFCVCNRLNLSCCRDQNGSIFSSSIYEFPSTFWRQETGHTVTYWDFAVYAGNCRYLYWYTWSPFLTTASVHSQCEIFTSLAPCLMTAGKQRLCSSLCMAELHFQSKEPSKEIQHHFLSQNNCAISHKMLMLCHSSE